MLRLVMRLRALIPAVLLPLILVGPVSGAEAFRPPAVPLVACDPYFSIWSPADKLTDAGTVHWTGKPQRLTSLVRIDGATFRIMGAEPAEVPALPQVGLEVLPTRTIYTFAGNGVTLSFTFLTAALPEDIDLLSRPVTYLTWSAESTDGKSHAVAAYLDAHAEIAVNDPKQQAVKFQAAAVPGMAAWRVGSVEQPVLQKKGDDLRIDWGYFYVAMARDQKPTSQVDSAAVCRGAFAQAGKLSSARPKNVPAETSTGDTVIAFATELGKVGAIPVSRWLMVAYDDLYSIQYMKQNLRPYWRRNGWEAADLLKAAARDYPSLQKRCAAFDSELMGDVTRAGGEHYAKICALAYRHCFAAGKFVADAKGQPLQFCKENHSNGCIGTSDVFYPMAPQFLFFGPTLAKSFLVPFMNYASSPHWTFPFAPHDLGTYPKANGQVYGGGERTEENQMPVEETGNVLLLIGAIAQMEGNAGFAGQYWPQLEKWAAYLKAKGFDPENQLCTDDFAGHLAHNVNLSAKAICALGSFAKLCQMRGETAKADEYFKLAREFAQRWVKEADDGDHFRLAFDRPNTWSQKYNLVWDRILGLNLFPAEVARKEMDFYKKSQNRYGLPLDSRKAYTKLDWILWTATLTQNRADFEALVDPVYLYVNETANRAPMSDWYQTVDAKKVGFTARPVVGGVFLQMLYDRGTWQKYARRDKTKAAGWAPMPEAPKISVVVPAADREPAVWQYTTTQPGAGWFKPGFDSSAWRQGRSGFGTSQTPSAVIGTTWDSRDIWLRREIDLDGRKGQNLQAWLHHDEDVEVYVNGVLALEAAGFVSSYDAVPFTAAGRAAFKPGKNLIAVHCHQTTGGQYIDLGLVETGKN